MVAWLPKFNIVNIDEKVSWLDHKNKQINFQELGGPNWSRLSLYNHGVT
jgi:hypothetical protein